VAEKIKLIYSLFTDIVIFASFIVSIINWNKIRENKLMILFPFYILFSLLIDIHDYFPPSKSFGAAPLNIFSVVEFFFFYNFYRMVFLAKSLKLILAILCLGFIISSILILFFLNKIYESENFFSLIRTHLFVEILVLENIFLVIPVLFYYRSLFNPPYIQNLVNDPIFLIMTGIIFCFSISTPILVFARTIANLDKQSYYYLNIISVIGFIIMHIFFIKAFINLKKCSYT